MSKLTAAFAFLLPCLSACIVSVNGTERDARTPRARGNASSDEARGFEGRVAGCRLLPGFLTVFLDEAAGQVWLALPPGDAAGMLVECLYVEGLATGLGSNPVGLDRGQIGGEALVRFRRVGDKVLVERQNLDFRARTSDPLEARATRDSFATSVLWAGEVAEVAGDGRVLVDFTSFVVRDAHGTADTLSSSGGSWSLDLERSALDARAVFAFPDNVEFEALLTFAGKQAGRDIRSTAPDPTSVTLVQHHSLVRLPDARYSPRTFHPRSGGYSLGFQDYAAPLDGELDVDWVVRHRLVKTDPDAARSKVVEPLVYYVDPGAPEPIRSALIEGASWWNTAFEAAGFIDAFRVEVLPAGAHPLDVRYNVIQWVHRSTRGWSYGNTVSDPRTGEIIKGHVSLGSLRVRQDRLLFEGLAGTAQTGTGGPDDPVQLALARIRQLSAHEVGHTLGFAHNFAASAWRERASVMDYPAPLIRVRPDGELDFSAAYAVGIGAWDVHSVRYLYSQPAPGVAEDVHLAGILREAEDAGLRYLTDADARAAGAAHPYANLWDNGTDPARELEESLRIRELALGRFGRDRIAAGRPLARLEEVLAPVYFHHRYQLDAALKMIGGVDYDHRVRGEATPGPQPVPLADQQRALASILQVLDPARLALPAALLADLHPRAPGHGANRELFTHRTSPMFDALGAAATMAEQAVSGLLQRERCARLAQAGLLDGVLNALIDDIARHGADGLDPLEHVVHDVTLSGLIGLAGDGAASGLVRDSAESALWGYIARGIPTPALEARAKRFLARAQDPAPEAAGPADPPPGSPIGMELCGCSQRF